MISFSRISLRECSLTIKALQTDSRTVFVQKVIQGLKKI